MQQQWCTSAAQVSQAGVRNLDMSLPPAVPSSMIDICQEPLVLVHPASTGKYHIQAPKAVSYRALTLAVMTQRQMRPGRSNCTRLHSSASGDPCVVDSMR